MSGKSVVLRFIRLLVTALLFPCSLYAQPLPGNPEPAFRRFTTENGLPSSETYFVHEDRNGYIWICTDRGVARYDGYRFRVFTTADGLLDNVVFSMYEDHKGRVWFLSFTGLLCYYENGNIIRYKYNHEIRRFINGYLPTFKSLVIDREDNLFYAIHDIGSIRISHSGISSILHKQEKNAVEVRGIGSQYLLSVTRSSASGNPVVSPVHFRDIPQQFGQRFTHFSKSAYLHVSNGQFLLAVDDTLILLNTGEKRQLGKINNLYAENGRLWVSTIKNGVLAYPLGQFLHSEPEFHFLKGLSVTSVLRDREGGYWFSTLEKGVFYTPGLSVFCFKESHPLLREDILCLNGKKNLMIAGNVNGYYLWTGSDQSYISGTSVLTPRVGIGGKETIFLSGSLPFYLRDRLPRELPSERNHFYNFIPLQDGGITVASRVLRYQGTVCTDTLYDFFRNRGIYRQNRIGSATMHKGVIYAGNANGLWKLSNMHLTQRGLNAPLFHARVSSLIDHPVWGVVAGTRGSGIYCLINDRIVRHITSKDGLIDDQINQLIIDEHHVIWAATNKGINRIALTGNGQISISLVTVNHGLPTNEITCLYSFGNYLWAGTKKGLCRIDKGLFNSSGSNECRVILERFVVGKHHWPLQKSYRLENDANNIRIFFRSTNYRVWKNRLFRYRLSKTDNWVFTDKPVIALSFPTSGNYCVEVASKNENGKWTKPVVLCQFTILPPIYTTWYFIAAMALLTLIMVYVLFRWRVRVINRRHELRETINQLEQKALRAQMNPHFIFNSLNSIQSFLMYEEHEKAERYLLRFAQLIRLTLNNSRETYISIAAEIDSLKRYLELEQMRFKDKFVYSVTHQLSEEEIQFGIPPMLIQPFVENAVHHGFKTVASGGQISVAFESITNGGLLCIVEDNGVGRKATMQHISSGHKSFGTRITEERLQVFREKYGEHFRIVIIDKEENGISTGTRVELRIPVVPPEEMQKEADHEV